MPGEGQMDWAEEPKDLMRLKRKADCGECSPFCRACKAEHASMP